MKHAILVIVVLIGCTGITPTVFSAIIHVPADQPDIQSAVESLIASGTSIETIAAPCRTPYGLAWDGVNLWCSDFETRRIYKLTPNGEVLDDFPSPAVYPTGLAWDGQHLWQADAHGTIIRLNECCQSELILQSPGPNPEGIAWDGHYFWISDSDSKKTYQMDPTGGMIDSFYYPYMDGQTDILGMTSCDEAVWMVDRLSRYILLYEITSDFFHGGFSMPGLDCRGIAYDGTNVWLSDIAGATLYKVRVDFEPGTIVLADGTYTGSRNRDIVIQGRAIHVVSENGPQHCIIDCRRQNRAFSVLYSGSRTSSIEGVTVRNGVAAHPNIWSGGAIYIRESNINLYNCVFINNQSGSGNEYYTTSSGNVYFNSSSGNVEQCHFIAHSGPCLGIVGSTGKDVIVRNCSFRDNRDGAIGVFESSGVSIYGSTFENNVSQRHGAGINADPADKLYVDSSFFYNNVSAGKGGAIFAVVEEELNFNHCRFVMNESRDAGGALYLGDESAHIVNCLFSRNISNDMGGALYAASGAILLACSFVDNYSVRQGGAVSSSTYSDLIVDSGIFWNNAPDQLDVLCNADITCSNIQSGWTGAGNIDADPMFDFGRMGDYCLTPASPCVDAGHGNASDWTTPFENDSIRMDQLTTRQDSLTDMGRMDMGYHYIPDQPDPDLRIRLVMPARMYDPGDLCWMTATVFNPSGDTLFGTHVFIWFELGDEFYCAPSFSGFDRFTVDVVPGASSFEVFAPFAWPRGLNPTLGLYWHAALTDPSMTRIIGLQDVYPMSW